MWHFFELLFSPDFMPHGHCYFWNPEILWLNVLADFVIALSYYTIPVALLYFIHKREDLIFDWMFLLFAIFILACGTTHVLEIWNVWHSHYALAGIVKVVTAGASLVTAVLLWKLIPKALRIPSISQLETANENLASEVIEREKAEAEVKELNTSLAARVAEATRNEREARNRAERESVLKDEFLATLSHELRTPLNAILGWAQLLRRKGTPEDLEKGLGVIDRNARIQVQLIEDLLDMSRIISGKLRLDIRRVDIVPIIEASIASVRPSAEAKGIEIVKALGQLDASIMGDAARLQQILWNLLSNAIKFTAKGGKVEVSFEKSESSVEIVVHDTGIGITAEFLPHVFERFRQADSSTTRATSGLGLGLSIVKQLVELHGGTVKAYSEGQNKGATFTVSLPFTAIALKEEPKLVKETARPILPSASSPIYEGLLSKLKILVVDDDAESRELVTLILANQGASVVTVSNVDEALNALFREEFSLIVSDIAMPQRDGYDLIREVRTSAHSKNKSTPAIAVTAFARSEDRTRAALAGFHSHIAKPIEPSELIAVAGAIASLKK